MSISDELMVRYYELLSDADLATCKSRDGVAGNPGGRHPMESKKALARELVARFHGETQALKPKKILSVSLSRRNSRGHAHHQRRLRRTGLDLSSFMKPVSSPPTERRAALVQQGAVKIDGEKWTIPSLEIPAGEIVLQAGKRKFARMVFGQMLMENLHR
jgi:tyrosyl-tRNA synthetase